MRILIVDDDAVSRLVLEHLVRAEGHEVLSASGTDEALGLLAAADTAVDIILCDYEMPDRNGLDLLEELQLQSASDMPAFVLITGTRERSELNDSRVDDVHGYLTKPVTSAIVSDAIATLSVTS